jgi:hypothetical protein
MAFTVVLVEVALTDTDFALDCDAVAIPTEPTERATVVSTTAAIFLFDDIFMSSFHLAEMSLTSRH